MRDLTLEDFSFEYGEFIVPAKITTEQFIEKARKVHKHNRYDYSRVTYINAITKVKIICIDHGEFFITPNSLTNGKGCKLCGLSRSADLRRTKQEDFIINAQKHHESKNFDYSLVKYVDCKTKVKIICPIHGIFETIPLNFSKGIGCRLCGFISTSDSKYKNTNKIIVEFIKVHGINRYDYSLVKYVDCKTKVKIICRVNNHGEFTIYPGAHLRGGGCKKCRSSNGENIIRNFLDEHLIVYEEQKRFADCKNKNPLSFDFYIPEINTCIEFDGVQHFKPSSFSSDRSEETKQKNLELIQHRDRIKTKYCEDHGIRLLRIPYTEKDRIPKILAEALNLGNRLIGLTNSNNDSTNRLTSSTISNNGFTNSTNRLTSSPGSDNMTNSFLDLLD